jgi:hypothetical protein
MKINASRYNLEFLDFYVQAGMVFGYDEYNTPFVTNGTLYDGTRMNIRFYDHTYCVWRMRHVDIYDRPALCSAIEKKLTKKVVAVIDGKPHNVKVRTVMRYQSHDEIQSAHEYGRTYEEFRPRSLQHLPDRRITKGQPV